MVEAAIDSAVNAILIIDEHGILQRVNPATEKLFGYARAELIGQNVHMLMPEPYHAAHDGYMRNYLTTGEKKIIGIGREVFGRRKDGTTFPMHLSVGEFTASGRLFFVGSINDISARAAAQAEGARQKTLFQAIFDNCPDAMVISDADHRITLCNPAALHIFRYEPGELIGKPTRVIFASDADYERVAGLTPALPTGGPSAGLVLNFSRKGGAQFPGAAAAADIIDNAGAHLGILKVIRDVSREVAQEQALRQVQRMEAIGQLTGGIAHDFNNLLTIITGNHELLELEITDEYQRDLLKRADDAAHMGARLTDRLLTFARRRPLNAVSVDLNEHVLGMMDLLRRTLGETISIRASLAPDLWVVHSDVSEIENAALNLAINARDAMPSGGTLMIETCNMMVDDQHVARDIGLAPGGYVRLSVSDTGEGIKPEILARVFEPFFTTKGAGKGTGLGLSVIYGFAKQSGGQVTIYSEPGRGTTVNLYLPRAASEAAARARPAGRTGARAAPGEVVLVVEDQGPVREVTLRRIAQLGYDVRAADSAAAALDVLRSGERIDLVFSDIVMPGGMTGFDLADWIGANMPAVPVVLTSGFAETIAQSLPHAGPAARILRKPYSGEDLADALRAGLDGRG